MHSMALRTHLLVIASLLLLLSPNILGVRHHKSLFRERKDEDASKIPACNAPGIVSCVLVDVNFDALKEDTIEVLPGQVMSKADRLEDGLGPIGYRGKDGSEAVVTVVWRAHKVTASINCQHPDKSYSVEPCPGRRCHVLIEESEEQNNPIIDSIQFDETVQNSIVQPRPLHTRHRPAFAEKKSPNASIVISVMFYYTPEFARVTSDPAAYVDGLVSNANMGYANSQINLRLTVFCAQELAGFEETDSPVKMLQDFRKHAGSDSATLNTADVALLVLSGPTRGICGIAYVNGYQHGGNFGWVGKNCHAVVTGHEIGHMFGAAHNKEISGGFAPNGGYEYGYLIPGGYVSIMAYNNTEFSKRINYFSSPSLLFNGTATGSATADVRKAHLERKHAMSLKGDESGKCPRQEGTTTTTTTLAPGQTTTTTTSTPLTSTTTTEGPTTTTTCPCMDHYWGWYCRTVSLFGCCTTDGFFNCKSSCKATCGLCDDEPTPTLTPDPNCEDSATSQTCSVLITSFDCCSWECRIFCQSSCNACPSQFIEDDSTILL